MYNILSTRKIHTIIEKYPNKRQQISFNEAKEMRQQLGCGIYLCMQLLRKTETLDEAITLYHNIMTESVYIKIKEQMTQEEKAKAYDDALLIAKSKIKNDKDHVFYEDDIIEIFPELKKGEDEKIREDLIQWIDEFPDTIWRGHYKEDILVWLKKQGEQKSVWTEEDEQIVKDIIAAIDALYYHGMVKWLKSLKERIG